MAFIIKLTIQVLVYTQNIRLIIFCTLIGIIACQNKKTDHTIVLKSPNTQMKALGLIGGTSWHSTIEYYKYINEAINQHYGNNTNPPLMIYTMNQAQVHQYQSENNWSGIADMLTEAGQRLQNGGVEKLMFCANTPHKVYNAVAERLDVPIIHIGDATAENIKKRGIDKVCFLGTKYTMTEDFMIQRIADKGIKVSVPEDPIIVEELHRIIIEELTYGKIEVESKQYVLDVIQGFKAQGIQGAVLGCTEFPLMIEESDIDMPIFNTSEIHAASAVDYILSDIK